MKKLINAILMLAASLNRIAALIERQNNTPALPAAPVRPNPTEIYDQKQITSVNHTHTSNPGYKDLTVKHIEYDKYKSSTQQKLSMPTEIDRIAKDIYDALSNKGKNPRHHDKVMADLAKKWPILFSSLKRLEKHFDREQPKNISSSVWKEVKKRDI
jgi:hypothetical protein